MAVLNSRNVTVNAWRERGYRDRKEGRPASPPAPELAAERAAYFAGRRCAEPEQGKRT